MYEEDTKCFLEVRVMRSVTSSYPVSFPDVCMWPEPVKRRTEAKSDRKESEEEEEGKRYHGVHATCSIQKSTAQRKKEERAFSPLCAI